MDRATISGIRVLSPDLMLRPDGLSVVGGTGMGEGETPPSGITGTGAQTQVVAAATGPEKSSFPGKNAQQNKEQQVADAVKNMNDFLQMVQRTLQFSMDEESGRMVVQIKDVETNKVIRQIPSERVLRLAEQMDKFRGMLFEEKA